MQNINHKILQWIWLSDNRGREYSECSLHRFECDLKTLPGRIIHVYEVASKADACDLRILLRKHKHASRRASLHSVYFGKVEIEYSFSTIPSKSGGALLMSIKCTKVGGVLKLYVAHGSLSAKSGWDDVLTMCSIFI